MTWLPEKNIMQLSDCKRKYDILSKNEVQDEQCMVKWPKQQSKI